MTTPNGGDALPVIVSVSSPEGLIAVPVVGYTVDTLPADVDIEGGPACPVYLVSAAEIASGQYVLRGDPAPMRLVTVADGRAVVGSVAPLAVYVVSGSLDPTPPTPPPDAPATLAATPSGATSVNLSWAAVTGATGYTVYRCTGYSCTPVASIGTDSDTSYSDTALPAATAYTYAVTATNAGGESAASPTATAVTGMAAAWTLDNTAAGYIDLIAGRTLAAGGTAPTSAAGIISNAAQFGGSGRLQTATATPLDAVPGFAVEAWAFFTTVGGTRMIASKDNNLATGREWALYNVAGFPTFLIQNTVNAQVFAQTGAAVLAINTWYHFVGVVTADQRARVYLNGSLLATSGILAGTIRAGTLPFCLGGRSTGDTGIDGRVDEPRVYQFGAAGDPGAVFWTARYNAGLGRRP